MNDTIQKIGQCPSIADLHFPDLEKYRKVLGKKFSELKRAIGLASHGVGVGAFVYLRRIFEILIEEAHKNAKATPGWNDEDYQKSRMAEKVSMLKGFLPDFLVENAKLYSIISLGIHELTEEECLKYFNVVKVGIELILDEKLEKKLREQKIKKAVKDIHDTGVAISKETT